MGIHGIYKEIGPGERIALSKLAVETYEQTGRPLRLAIDISIWLFQIQSSKGGTNPALRTFYYRLLRLISLSIHPLFVFDGPNKPPFKRNKKTGPSVASIPEFLAKQLLKQFGLPFHLAPGEAEAECALLQREGIVDAVLSEDVDTLMFGSGLTLCKWSSEGTLKSKVATHVNVYDAKKTKDGKSGLDREGMVLVALMSGGDYIPEGIPGCGPKLACEAARAGFGRDLCKISKKDKIAIGQWRERLAYELRTNESKFFKQKHKVLVIPDDFPNIEVLGYYTHPVVSPKQKLDRLKQTLRWDQEIDFGELRIFTADAFDWRCLAGAKKFVRNLAPALLVRELRMRGDPSRHEAGNIEEIQEMESKLVKALHGKRSHITTDNMTELRLTFCPIDLVKIDLDSEEVDDINNEPGSDSEEDVLPVLDEEAQDPAAPSKKRAPSTYDPTQLDKIWVLETWVKVGVPLTLQDWEESFRNHKKYLAAKTAARDVAKAGKAKRTATTSGMPRGALDRYTKVTKAGSSLAQKLSTAKVPEGESQTLEHPPMQNPELPRRATPAMFCEKPSPLLQSPRSNQQVLTISLLSSPVPPQQAKSLTSHCLPPVFSPTDGLPDSVTKRKRRTPIRRWHTMPTSSTPHSPDLRATTPPPTQLGNSGTAAVSSPELPSPSVLLNTPVKDRTGPAPEAQEQAINILSSPPRTISEWLRRSQSATPSKPRNEPTTRPPPLKAVPFLPSPVKELDMTSSPKQPKKQKPSRQPLTDTTSNLKRSCRQIQTKSATVSEHISTAGNLRRSPRQHPGSFSPASSIHPAAWNQHQIKKRNIALRESLEGAWKLADQIDLTVSPERPKLSSKALRGKGKLAEAARTGDVAFLGGDVSIVDLTASPG